uniref:Uncharacterized protein n=1 Tax=Podoviridae sp. ct2nF21 TaxID=2826537 RepID=A0A8S5NGT9_9CAUD|nr:MAG TPA: hypothetical protein [Podoviridae sp. ct2nF21]
MYSRFIVDELGYVLYKCCDLTEYQIDAILMHHPDWSIKCIEC